MVNCNEIPWFVYIPDYECGTAETCDLADKGEAGTQANYQPKSFVFNSDMQQLLTINSGNHYLVHSIAHDEFKSACEELHVSKRF